MLTVQHLYGDANVMADPISRARWGEFHRRCAQIGVSPQRVTVCPAARDLYAACAGQAAELRHEGTNSFAFAELTCGAFKITREAADGPPARGAWPWPASSGEGGQRSNRRQGQTSAAAPQALAAGERASSSIPHCSDLVAGVGNASQYILGLAMPPQAPTPGKLKLSALGPRASTAYAKSRVASFTEGGGDMAFSAPLDALERMTEAIDEGLLYGINANTAVKDARAWDGRRGKRYVRRTARPLCAQRRKRMPIRSAILISWQR